MGMASEFKEFAMKGNVVDMAVGVIIGGAFGKIVSSLVGDVIMPVFGNALGGMSFADMATSLGVGPDGQDVLLKYGAFLQTVFMAIRGINKLKKRDPAAPPPAPPREEVLLSEIRDLLAKRGS